MAGASHRRKLLQRRRHERRSARRSDSTGATLGGGGAISNMATADGVVYLTEGPANGNDGVLLAFSGGGTLLFSADTPDLNSQPYPPAPPTVSDGRVYVGDFQGGVRVYALPQA